MMHRQEPPSRRRQPILPLFAGAVLLVLLGGCSLHGSSKVAHDKTVPVAVTPNTINKLPENINAVTITITNGAFTSGQIVLQQQGASIVHVVNNDSVAYQLQVTPNLVAAMTIAAGTTTDVGFTSNGAGDFTGQLLPEKGGAVLASIDIRIQSAGGVNP